MSKQSNVLYLGESLLSKIIEENNFTAIGRHRIDADDFVTKGEQEVFQFICTYAKENGYNCPSPDLVAHTFDEFNVRFGVNESYEYLVKNLKGYLAKRKLYNLMANEASDKFETMAGAEFLDYFQEQLDIIRKETKPTSNIGVSAFSDVDKYIEELDKRKSGESLKVWKSAYPSLPNYLSGNVYCFYGFSGRGKSLLTTVVEAVNFAQQGATVLIWSLELSSFEVLTRIYSHLSAKEDLELGGFEINKVLSGDVDGDYVQFVKSMNEKISGNLNVRGVDDDNFYDRSCKALEADILEVNPDVVIVDPPYLMSLEPNKDKVTGGAMALTSQRIRQITGIHKLVTITVTQAEEREEKEVDGERELTIPSRKEIKKSKAFLEDSSAVYGLDTAGEAFAIKIGKGRNGGEGKIIRGVFKPSIGVIYEPTINQIERELEELNLPF